MDLLPLDDLRSMYANCSPGLLLAMRKLLDPESVFIYGGISMPYQPGQIDYLMGYVLWDHPLLCL